MNTSELTIIAAALVAAGAVIVWASSQAQQMDPTNTDAQDPAPAENTDPGILETAVLAPIRNTLGLWKPPTQYAQAIAQAEQANGLPTDLLARLLYQESHYRADIIRGATRSSAGAIGIAQFMPATARQFGIDPTDPFASIAAAGRYLGQLYAQFGNWTEAVAAYNWGPGNVSRKGLAAAPQETRNYFAQILGDINASNGTNYA